MRVWFVALSLFVLASCNLGTPTPSTQGETTLDTSICTALLDDALTSLQSTCDDTGRNQACYVNERITATLRDNSMPFDAVGDVANITDIERLTLADISANPQEWGFAMLQLQANLPDTLPGQNVTVLLFGGTEFAPLTPDSGLQAYYVTTGIGEINPCNDVPADGMLVQTPSTNVSVNFMLNGVEFQLGSTAYIRTEPNNQMIVDMLEGRAIVTAESASQMVVAGTRTTVELDIAGFAIGAPTPPEPYPINDVSTLPVSVLPDPIEITPPRSASSTIGLSTLDDPDAGRIVGDISVAGERDTYTLELRAGQTIFLDSQNQESTGLDMRLTDPSGNELFRDSARYSNQSIDIEQTGTHTLTFFSNNDSTGPYEVIVWDVPAVSSQAIRPATASSGPTAGEAEGTLRVPGERHTYTMALTAGQTIFLDTENEGSSGILMQLTDPDNNEIFRANARYTVDAVQIEQTGTHTLTFFSNNDSTGPYSVTVWDVPDVDAQPIRLAPPDPNTLLGLVEGTISVPGEVHPYTFTATTGDYIFYDAIEDTNFDMYYDLFAPDGTHVFNGRRQRADFDEGEFELTQTGTYTIVVKGNQDATGDYAFRLWRVPIPQPIPIFTATAIGTASARGGLMIGEIASPGAFDVYTFDAQAGQPIYVESLDESPNTEIRWQIIAPDNTVALNGVAHVPLSTTLEQNGTYTVIITGVNDTVAPYEIQIRDFE